MVNHKVGMRCGVTRWCPCACDGCIGDVGCVAAVVDAVASDGEASVRSQMGGIGVPKKLNKRLRKKQRRREEAVVRAAFGEAAMEAIAGVQVPVVSTAEVTAGIDVGVDGSVLEVVLHDVVRMETAASPASVLDETLVVVAEASDVVM